MSFEEILDMSWQNLNQYFVELSAMNDEMKKDIEEKKEKGTKTEKSLTLAEMQKIKV